MLDERDSLVGLIGWIVLLWAIANFGPHLLVYLIFDDLYFGLPFHLAVPA